VARCNQILWAKREDLDLKPCGLGREFPFAGRRVDDTLAEETKTRRGLAMNWLAIAGWISQSLAMSKVVVAEGRYQLHVVLSHVGPRAVASAPNAIRGADNSVPTPLAMPMRKASVLQFQPHRCAVSRTLNA
jgi:hypothetical protein